ncbi:MAG: hypothetical protein ACOYBE_11890, partial [Blautia sp.]
MNAFASADGGFEAEEEILDDSKGQSANDGLEDFTSGTEDDSGSSNVDMDGSEFENGGENSSGFDNEEPAEASKDSLKVGNPSDAPSVQITLQHDSGGNVVGDGKNGNMLLIGKSDSNCGSFSLKMEANFTNGKANALNFTLDLPYMYYEDGIIKYTTDLNKVPQDQQGDKLMGIQATVTNCHDFDVTNGTTLRGESEIVGGAANLIPGTAQVVNLKFNFYGPVPENASVVVTAGGGYETYYDNSENATRYDYQTGRDADKYTFICSNLQWETTATQIAKSVMWDHYNYVVYEIMVKNTSEDTDSVINNSDINIKMPTVSEPGNYGISGETVMPWIYQDGKPVPNPDFAQGDRSLPYIGVPLQGGALVYDVTGYTKEELEEWDLEKFSNIPEATKPYYVTDNGTIHINDERKLQAQDSFTYYIAIPVPSNLPNALNYQFTTDFLNTIYFGNNYSWTLPKTSITEFIAPDPNFTHEKYVLDDAGEKADEADISLKDTGSYYLSGYQNTGNLPAFHAYSVDTLPEDFTLKKLSILMERPKAVDPADPGASTDPVKEPELADAFADDNIFQFEFQEGDTDPVFVNLPGALVPDGALSDDTVLAWMYDFESALKVYLEDHPDSTFLGRVRVNFKERIERGEALNAVIKVSGQVGVNANYLNTLDTGFEEWIYKEGTTDYEGGYTKISQTVTADEAQLNTHPAQPVVQVDAFTMEEEAYIYKKELNVPINTEHSGFRYELGNTNGYNLIDGIFSTGDLLFPPFPGDQQSEYGLITNQLVVSKGLLDLVEFHHVTFHYNDGTEETVEFADFPQTRDDNGNLVWPMNTGDRLLLSAEFVITFMPKNQPLSEDVFISVEGYPNLIADIEGEGVFKTDYLDDDLNVEDTDTAVMKVENIDPYLYGESFDQNGQKSPKNSAGVDTPQTQIQGLTVANKSASGYEFQIENRTLASSGGVDLLVDLSQNVGTKDQKETVVKGFDTEKIIFGNWENTVDIQEVWLFGSGQDPQKDQPVVKIPVKNLKKDPADGSLYLEKADYPKVDRVSFIKIRCSDYKGQPQKEAGESETEQETEKLTIRLEGTSDWFDDLDAKLTFSPRNPYMSDKIISVTARLHVDRPSLSVHTHVEYYENTQEISQAKAANTDGNEMNLAVPYDRDFKFRAEFSNDTISVLDDTDIFVELPVKDGNQGDEAHTGFHTTKVEISQKLLDQFQELESICLTDVDGTEKTFTYNKKTKAFADGSDSLKISDGVLQIQEDELIGWGIPYLQKVSFAGNLVKVTAEEDKKDFWMDFYGFEDSQFGTRDMLKADTKNYLDGIREEQYCIAQKDTAVVMVSKMYFDTVIAAGYTEGATADRFDKISTPVEQVRRWYRNCSHVRFNDNSELDLGYKSLGSYMVDFRQYLNVGKNYPQDPTVSGPGNYILQEHQDWPYVYTQSLNTAAELSMTVDLPVDSFETYYLKVDPRAKDYFQSIEVIRKDGTSYLIDSSSWQGNSVETSANGDLYFRISLLGDTAPSYGSEESGYYKAPTEDMAENPVSRLIIHLSMNEKEQTEEGQAADPDFGTWYTANDQSTKYMFEITGRFYAVNKKASDKSGLAEAKVTASMEVGGEIGQGAARTGAKAKSRREDGSNLSGGRSGWSYQNQYRWYYSSNGCHWGDDEYDARHMVSTARVIVHHTPNQVAKGVHEDTLDNEDFEVKFGDKCDYPVAFFRNTANRGHDYVGGKGNSYWIDEDEDDWAGKVSYGDQVRLVDKLPSIRPDEESDYYGFLTEDIRISEKIYKYLQQEGSIQLYKKIVKEDGSETAVSDPVVLDKTMLGNPENGFYTIRLKYASKEETADADNEILLAEGEFLNSYEMILRELPGNGEYTSELGTPRHTAEPHDTNRVADIIVGGYVCSIYSKEDTQGTKDATNTMSPFTKADNEAAEMAEGADTAVMMGYRIPFQGGFSIKAKESQLYDYEDNNQTPTNAGFEVKIWNRKDGNAADGSEESAGIKKAEAAVNLNGSYGGNFRLKKIRIPSAFVEGNWFRVESIKLSYGNNKQAVLTPDGLGGIQWDSYLKKDSAGDYVLDVNQFLVDQVTSALGNFNYYSVQNTSTSYLKEQVSNFTVVLGAVHPDVTDGTSVLDGGQYLSPSKTNTDAAFSYEGVYVDRTEADVKADAWTLNSRPTVINPPNNYTDNRSQNGEYQYLDVDFTALDRNSQ